MCVPGAIRSGARQPLLQPDEPAENEATWSSHGAAVPMVSAAPTARICGSYARIREPWALAPVW